MEAHGEPLSELNQKEIEFLSVVQFLGNILDKTITVSGHLDTQVNILLGITSGIFLLSLARFLEGGRELPLFILSFFAALSTLIGLISIRPPRFMRKQGQEESLMYNRKIASFGSGSEYFKELTGVISKQDHIVKQYALEIHNLIKFYYLPKRNMFHLARETLIIGIALSLIVFTAGVLLGF